MQRLLTIEEVQERLRLSPYTIKKLIREDPDFKTVKLGRRRLMREEALAAYVSGKEEALPGVKS